MTRSDTAVELFSSGFSCSQAVLAAYSDVCNIDRETALRLSSGFGGGVKSGEICGAISGAVMVVGMRHGQVDASDKEARYICGEKVKKVLHLFRERNGHIVCRELLHDIMPIGNGADAESKIQIRAQRCTQMVRDVMEFLEHLDD